MLDFISQKINQYDINMSTLACFFNREKHYRQEYYILYVLPELRLLSNLLQRSNNEIEVAINKYIAPYFSYKNINFNGKYKAIELDDLDKQQKTDENVNEIFKSIEKNIIIEDINEGIRKDQEKMKNTRAKIMKQYENECLKKVKSTCTIIKN